jgi:hypothetical protein
MTRAAFSGRLDVRKKAASPGPNSSSGGSEAQSSSAFVPSTAALPEPLCTQSGARVASSLARTLEPPYRLVAAAQVSVASRWPMLLTAKDVHAAAGGQSAH